MRAFLLLLVARLCGADPENPFHDCLPTATNITSTSSGWSFDNIEPCLHKAKMNLHDMLITMEDLYFGESTIYSFTDLAKDSQASVQKNKCGLHVHDVRVDLRGELEKLYREFVESSARELGLTELGKDEALSAAKLHRLLMANTSVSVYEFQTSLYTLFSRLQDAHTIYVWASAVLAMFPVNFELQESDGRIRVFAEPALITTPSAKKIGTRYLNSTLKEVAQINGERALDWLQKLADAAGNYIDKGSRLNNLITNQFGWPAAFGVIMSLGENRGALKREDVSVEFTFADGSSATVDWFLQADLSKTTAAFLGHNPAYAALAQAELMKAQWKKARAKDCAETPGCRMPPGEFAEYSTIPLAARAYGRLLKGVPQGLLEEAALLAAEKAAAAHERAPHLAAPQLSRLEAPRTLLDELPQAPLSADSCLGLLDAELIYGNGGAITVLRKYDTMIYKLNTFEVGAPVGGFGISWMDAFQSMSSFAKKHGIKRVLFDLIGNGGGAVLVSEMLQAAVLKEEASEEALCNRFNKRLGEYWEKWIESFAVDPDASLGKRIALLKEVAAQKPFAVVKWWARWELKYLQGLVKMANELGVNIDIAAVNYVEGMVEKAASTGELVNIMETTLTMGHGQLIPSEFYGTEGFLGSHSGWFPFTGTEILDPKTLVPFQPAMSGFTDPMQEKWGGVLGNYSQRGIFDDCKTAFRMAKDLGLRDHPFEDIAVVTDGLAGSAASQFPSRLMASGHVTMFTYGGNGQPMDTSSFCGGNVLGYPTWWPKVALAAEWGMWLQPGSSWEAYSRRIHQSGPGQESSPVYPMPLPKTATVNFNFNMMYVKEFASPEDKGYSLLPRQFYRLPAHKHYNQWPKSLNTLCANPAGLSQLYSQIISESWCALRAKPQYEGNGWNSSCLPDSQRATCPGVTPTPRPPTIII